MKKFLALVTIMTLMAFSAQAATVWWSGTLYGGNAYYTNGLSWKQGGVSSAYGTPPQSSDEYGLINNNNGDPLIMPIIDCPITNIYVPLTLGIGSDKPGTLTVTNGGSIVAHKVAVGRGSSGNGTLYIMGGNMTVDDSMDIGVSPAEGGEVIISQGGFLYLKFSPSFSDVNSSNSFINILGTNSLLWIDGDQISQGFVDDGYIKTTDSFSLIEEIYNFDEDRTEYTVVPEPVILGLVSLLGFAFLRRR